MRGFSRFLSSSLAVIGLCGLASCAGPAREGDGMDPGSRLRRAVFVQVKNDETIFGDASVWGAEIARWCWENHACEHVWHDGEADDSEADMKVEVTVLAKDSGNSRVDTQGAVLDFLAWSTLPLVPLWIEDVQVTPALRVQVQCSLRVWISKGSGGHYDWAPLSIPNDELSGIEISTCMRERYPLASWSTLGAIFVPPFLFKAGDPEQIQESIAQKVWQETARRIGLLVRESRWQEGELLRDLTVEESPEGLRFRCSAAPSVGAIRFCVGQCTPFQDPESPKIRRELVSPDRTSAGWECSIPDGPGIRGRLLRVEAIDRIGRRLPYSVLVPPSTTVADAEVRP